jgi:hypothetical protein
MVWPIDDLFVRIARILGAERRVSNQALEHDRTQRPPIALLAVPTHHEHLGRDIVWRPHSRECLLSIGHPILLERHSRSRTSRRRFFFHVAIVSARVIVRLIGVTSTLFREACRGLSCCSIIRA